jgi:predicted nucleic acid-binding protein
VKIVYLPDSNIVLRYVQPTNSLYQIVVDSIDKLQQNGEKIVLVPQVLVEFWVVATRPKEVNGFGMTTLEAQNELENLQRLFVVLPENEKIFNEWKAIVTKHKVSGKPSHDARIVAAMKTHKIDKILTLNPQDFKRFDEIISITPQQVLDET